jgi:hypothetical protein
MQVPGSVDEWAGKTMQGNLLALMFECRADTAW